MKNTYVFMIIQAILLSLLFFSEGYVKYGTIALLLLIDLVIFIGLLTDKWSFKELMVFAAIFCSGMFVVFYLFTKSLMTIIFGVVLVILFLVIALLDLLSESKVAKSSKVFERLQKPEEPDYYYDFEYDSLPVVKVTEEKVVQSIIKPAVKVDVTSSKTPEPVMHIKHAHAAKIQSDHTDVKNRLAAKAVATELEKEASSLKNAEKMIKDLEIYNAEKELLKESKALEDVQRQIDAMKKLMAQKNVQKTNVQKVAQETKNAQATATAKKVLKEDTKKNVQAKKELQREASELLKVQKQINEINRLKQITELQREAKELKNAEKKANNLQLSNKQEQLAKQVKELQNAQKQINTVTKLNRANELQREAKELQNAQKKASELQFLNKQAQLVKQAKSIANAQKQINTVTKLNQSNELKREVKELQNAQKKASELQFLNKQEQLVKQAKSIAQAQKEIDEMNKNTKKSLVKQTQTNAKNISITKKPVTVKTTIKTVKASEESFYFATDTGNKFHEPGCLSIKNVPKNKLVLYTNKKDAMKKGLQACSVCIPK